MIVSDQLDIIKAETGYVEGSLILKSYDSVGATYKWLFKYEPTILLAVRREIFLSTTTTEEDVEDRTVGVATEVQPAV